MHSRLLRHRLRSDAKTACRTARRRALAAWVFAWALMLPMLALAQAVSDPTPLQYRDAAEEARFHALAAELRCVQCQNQSLADSNAQIAHDLRREVLELMRQGKSDTQIKDFLVARYGEFVLYRPRVESTTWLLWFGPALVLLAGGYLVARVIRARASDTGANDGTATDLGRASRSGEDEQEW